MKARDYDVIVIGGGPAGLMTSIAASSQGARVCLLEKGAKLGRKLIISGGGRCNVTNAKEQDELIKQMPGNGRFLFSVFSQFNNRDIIHFFEELGVALKEEDRGRMFPVTDKAVTVAGALIERMKRQGVEVRLNSPVEQVVYENGQTAGVLLKNGERLASPCVVICVGGCSVPQTGSTGDGYEWARAAGHTITDLYPTEVPLTANDPYIRDKFLQGLSLREIELTLYDPKGKKVSTQEGDMIFTHFGISGPAALRQGHYVSVTQKKFGAAPLSLKIDLMPQKHVDEVMEESWQLLEEHPKKAVKNVIKGFVPERLIPVLLSLANIAEETTLSHMRKQQWRDFAQLVKAFPLTITGTLSLEEAFITGGGVSTKEIDPRTMQSKLMPGLFFAGEVMDVHAHTGGYNITIAFSTGYVAGTHSAQTARVLA
ncbi:NAD(P)/FAD-dependent oxidoreductase [Brevibacillus composti]|uniref:NAD(P)/FAD-dependent oxidoreductase n=1 Tax=Brevibacillus composti TaxID=2796470 RepID=A0A7T5EN31_9BACL|nr:NAD(P)/FAD-dependent oxidoreductase [Brevibacillus composti]QQE75576.1 NAD(P)/FAD-dependent oxidoreductase [Brevibacillus composti]QUO42602.1 NAD(P)/FAD-dependent oxidoreductase [Brevibacillus composti]